MTDIFEKVKDQVNIADAVERLGVVVRMDLVVQYNLIYIPFLTDRSLLE